MHLCGCRLQTKVGCSEGQNLEAVSGVWGCALAKKNFLSLPFAGSSGSGVLLFVSFLVTAEVVVLDQLKSNRIGPDRIGLDDGYATAGAIEMSFTDLLVARMYTVGCTSS